jgi:hypothetical protein
MQGLSSMIVADFSEWQEKSATIMMRRDLARHVVTAMITIWMIRL